MLCKVCVVQFLCTAVQFLCKAVRFLCTAVRFLCTAVRFLCTAVQFLCTAVQFLCTAVHSVHETGFYCIRTTVIKQSRVGRHNCLHICCYI